MGKMYFWYCLAALVVGAFIVSPLFLSRDTKHKIGEAHRLAASGVQMVGANTFYTIVTRN